MIGEMTIHDLSDAIRIVRNRRLRMLVHVVCPRDRYRPYDPKAYKAISRVLLHLETQAHDMFMARSSADDSVDVTSVALDIDALVTVEVTK